MSLRSSKRRCDATRRWFRDSLHGRRQGPMHTFTLSLFSSALTPTGSNKGCSITRGNSYLYQPRKKLFKLSNLIISLLYASLALFLFQFHLINPFIITIRQTQWNVYQKRKRYPLNNQVIQLASHRFAKMNISKLKLLGSTSISSNVDWWMQRKKKLNQAAAAFDDGDGLFNGNSRS